MNRDESHLPGGIPILERLIECSECGARLYAINDGEHYCIACGLAL